MADVKISQLPAATTPLDGTEVLPIVQSATTKQVSIANVTAGRAMAASSLTLTTPLAVTSGGTGIATAAQGALLSATAADTFSATRTPTLGLAGTAAGTLGLSGSTSGVVTLATAATAGTWTLTLPTSGGTNGYILTTNGAGVSSWTNPTALGIDLDVGTTAITNGTAGYVLFQGSGNVLQQNANLFWDNTNSYLGLGTTSPTTTLTLVNTSQSYSNNPGNAALKIYATATNAASPLFLNLGYDASADVGYIQPVHSGAGGTFTNLLVCPNGGNLGLGITPSAWSVGKAVEVGALGTSIWAANAGDMYITSNAYYNGGFKYANAGLSATGYEQTGGAHKWFTTGTTTGAIGGTIAFTQPMTLDASGNLGIGVISPGSKIDIASGSGTAVTAVTIRSLAGNSNGFKIVTNSSTDDVSLVNYYAAPLIFGTNNTERARFNAGAPILCLSGGSTTATGTGIAFPATQSASSNANTLDDYEEGSWTPTLTTASGTPTYSFQEGTYVKVGQLVRVGGIIGITNSGSLTGTITINLPFTATAGAYGSAIGVASDGLGFTWPINGVYNIQFQLNSGQSTAALICVGAGASQAIAYNQAGVAGTWYIRVGFVFRADG